MPGVSWKKLTDLVDAVYAAKLEGKGHEHLTKLVNGADIPLHYKPALLEVLERGGGKEAMHFAIKNADGIKEHPSRRGRR